MCHRAGIKQCHYDPIRTGPGRAGPGQLQHASHIWHGPQAQVEPAPEAEAEAEAACVFYVQLPTIYTL